MTATIHPLPVSQPHPDPIGATLAVLRLAGFTLPEIAAFDPCPIRDALQGVTDASCAAVLAASGPS